MVYPELFGLELAEEWERELRGDDHRARTASRRTTRRQRRRMQARRRPPTRARHGRRP